MKHCMTAFFASMMILSSAMAAYAGYFEQGSRYYVYRNYAKAREMFQKAMDSGKDGNAAYFLGEIEKNEGNFDKAVEYYQAALGMRIQRKYLNLAYWNIIILTEQKGDYTGMVKICREVYDRHGDQGAKNKVESLINKSLWTDNKEAQEFYQQGIELRKKSRNDEAETAFRKALHTDSTFLAPQFELGLMYFKKGDTGESLRYLREVAQRIPFYGEVRLLMGDIYLQKGWYREAVPHFEEALEYGFLDKSTKYLVHMKLATSYYNIRDYTAAKEKSALASKANPKALEPLLLLSSITIKEENYPEALSSLEKARKIEPDNPEILFLTGSIHYKMNNQKYIQYFSRLYEITGEAEGEISPKYHKAFALLMKHYYEHGEHGRAGRIFESLPEKAHDYDTVLSYARAESRLGNYEKALKPMEKLHLKSDEDRYLLCQLYARTGRVDRARQSLLGLSDRNTWYEKARREPSLRNIVKEIEEEQRKSVEAPR